MNLLKPNDPKLNLLSRELSDNELDSVEVTNLIFEMKRIATGERTGSQVAKRSTVGLSAPQLGQLVRVILVDMKATPDKINYDPDLKIFINPEIISASESESLMREGCWSTGQICGAVLRPDQVTVSALNEKGERIILVSDNPFQSHILQHEIDHLDGIRFPSRVRDPKQLHLVGVDEFQDYRQNWKDWTKLCPFEDWLKIYRGGQDANV